LPEKTQYFTRYSGGDPHQPYRVDYNGLFSRGFYLRYRGDEARTLFRYRESDEGKTYERMNEDGTWVHSETIQRYVWLGSTDTVEEIDHEEAKRIATMLGFPEVT
jgi:hypothetical protein